MQIFQQYDITQNSIQQRKVILTIHKWLESAGGMQSIIFIIFKEFKKLEFTWVLQ